MKNRKEATFEGRMYKIGSDVRGDNVSSFFSITTILLPCSFASLSMERFSVMAAEMADDTSLTILIESATFDGCFHFDSLPSVRFFVLWEQVLYFYPFLQSSPMSLLNIIVSFYIELFRDIYINITSTFSLTHCLCISFSLSRFVCAYARVCVRMSAEAGYVHFAHCL